MDMTNITAGGPSYGLLDVIFGSKPKEVDESDGQGFGALMNLVQALKNGKKDQGETMQDGNWTATKEIAPGKNIAERNVVVTPEMMIGMGVAQLALRDMALAQERNVGQLVLGKNMQELMEKNPKLSPPEAGVIEQVKPDSVNQLLREKSLSPLNSNELALLQAVNHRLQANNSVSSMEQEGSSGGAVKAAGVSAAAMQSLHQMQNKKTVSSPILEKDPLAANSPENPMDTKFMKELGVKAQDAGWNIKEVESQSIAAPETFVSTESYLKMHDSIADKNAKSSKADEPMQLPSKAKSAAPVLALQEQAVRSAAEGNGSHTKNGKEETLGKTKVSKEDSEGVKDAAAPLAAGLMKGLSSNQEINSREVFLNPAKPQEMKSMLVGEMVQGVNLHAGKGGGEMRLVIHPDDLGEVKLKVGTKNGKVEVQIQTENEQVASLLRSGAKELESSLGGQQLSLAKFEVQVSDKNSVVAADNKSGLSDQFFSQNQQNFQNNPSLMSDNSGFSQWGGSWQQQQAENLYPSDEGVRANSVVAKKMVNSSSTRPRLSSQRLDVVA